MCQENNKLIPRGKDCTAYKVLIERTFSNGTTRYCSPFHRKRYEMGVTYEDTGFRYAPMLKNYSIYEGFMHACAKLEDAKHLANFLKHKAAKLRDWKDGKKRVVIVEVILHNTAESDELYMGIFNYNCHLLISYACKRITPIKVVKTVPD